LNFKRYFEFGKGIVPIILSCPHGGYKRPNYIPEKEKGVNIADKNTYIIAKRIVQELKEKNIKIYYIFCKIHRSKVDLNRPPRFSVAFNRNSQIAKEIHQSFHSKIQEFAQECVDLYNKCLFIDLHGFTKPHIYYPDIIFGNIFGNTLKIKNIPSNDHDGRDFWGFAQIIDELSKHFLLDDGLGFTDFNLPYSGGYITHQFYKKENINAIQLELAKKIRINVKLTKIFINAFVSGILKSI